MTDEKEYGVMEHYDYIERECPACHKKVNYWDMIWLNGKCTCPECYERASRKRTS